LAEIIKRNDFLAESIIGLDPIIPRRGIFPLRQLAEGQVGAIENVTAQIFIKKSRYF